jgi:hypothetical protein
MQAWITENLFTMGIEEKEVKPDRSCEEGCIVTIDGDFYMNEGRDWHRTKESAIGRAWKMQQDRIQSLKIQLAKVEAMRFK